MIKPFYITITIVLSVIFLYPIGALAVTANPEPVTIAQPDGSKLTLKLNGDERKHYSRTTDNYTVLQDSDGYYKYAIDSLGKLKPGYIRAHNPENRKATESHFLQSISTGLRQKDSTSVFGTHNTLKRASITQYLIQPESGLRSATVPTQRYLVILVNFADVKFSRTNADFTNMLNQTGYTATGATGYTGSVKDYYTENSMGNLVPQFDVVGPVTLSQNMAYYGGNDASGNDLHPREMVLEACTLANNAYSSLNFKNYDNDGDKVVDNIAIFYAGYAESNGASANTIWPHQWSVSGVSGNKLFDGVYVSSYSCSSELKGVSGTTMEGIGTFCHEFGHVLGLPDLYDTDGADNGQFFDSNSFNLMASGNYNNNANTPPYLSIFERKIIGWSTSIRLSGDTTITGLSHIGNSNKAFYIHTNPQPAPGENDTEWFYLENRQQTGWDSYIPGHGLVITHVDLSDSAFVKYWNNGLGNAYASHPCYDLLEADGIANYASRSGDPFPGTSGRTDFTDSGIPNSLSREGVATATPVTQITESSNLISFIVGKGVKSISTAVTETVGDNLAIISQNGEIRLNGLVTGASASLYNVAGELLSDKTSTSGQLTFPVRANGVYIIRLIKNGSVRSYKVVAGF
ncbi:M6 family metalloprotease domain-containing protein [Parabacteroides sp. FAFU027]|uniref:M6 family metalloprotease domain-containing protein n=1 Tax=Parabacteroides sp. FAFU027 TaxID=2922715 RepID=UPI001FAE75DA|nr:M6 family metalloprotease domain-containing protein [Parabacteroides sp. FAFU027]